MSWHRLIICVCRQGVTALVAHGKIPQSFLINMPQGKYTRMLRLNLKENRFKWLM